MVRTVGIKLWFIVWFRSTHYAPHAYWLVCAKEDPEGLKPLSRHLVLDKAEKVAQDGGHIVIERWHAGCSARWRNP